MAAAAKILKIQEPTGFGPGNGPKNLLENRLVTRNRERTLVRKSVLLFGLQEKVLEDRMVQVSSSNDEPSRTASYTDRHVTGRNIRRSITGAGAARRGGNTSLLAPPLQHLANANDAADVVGFSDSGRHFPEI